MQSLAIQTTSGNGVWIAFELLLTPPLCTLLANFYFLVNNLICINAIIIIVSKCNYVSSVILILASNCDI